MSDRELLELAAKAVGLYGVDPRGDDDLWETNATDEDGYPSDITWGMRTIGGVWNPLVDDGDALRLAVKLCMQVECSKGWQHASVYGHSFQMSEEIKGSADAATRRAIVRAAAEIGRSTGQEEMKGGGE